MSRELKEHCPSGKEMAPGNSNGDLSFNSNLNGLCIKRTCNTYKQAENKSLLLQDTMLWKVSLVLTFFKCCIISDTVPEVRGNSTIYPHKSGKKIKPVLHMTRKEQQTV